MTEDRLPQIHSTTEPTLPYAWYVDRDIFALEREHIFMREWLVVAREEEIPNAEDSKVVDVLGESIILLRNQNGKLRAFHNVCKHRGTRLCAAAAEAKQADRIPLSGGVIKGRGIVCPYHAWVYDWNGKLSHAPHMSAASDFEIENIQLDKVAVQSWAGFVFVNLSSDPMPEFSEQVAPLEERYLRYPLSELKTAHKIRYRVNANWKALCENFNECYHCGPVHPELCKVVPAFRVGGGVSLDWSNGIPHREGATTFTKSGTSNRRTFPDLNSNEQKNHLGDLLYPNLFLSVSSDYVVALILKPESCDETLIDCYFLFESFEMNRAEFDPKDAIDFWDIVNQQDWAICERVQAGMGARIHASTTVGGTDRGMLSPMEDWSLDIRHYVEDRIGAYVNR